MHGAAACVMLALWLFTMLLSVSPALHHAIHPDSAEGTHQCLITAFQKCTLESGAAATATVIVSLIFWGFFIVISGTFIPSLGCHRSSSPRAPPVCLSF